MLSLVTIMIGIRFGAKRASQDKSWLIEHEDKQKRDALSKIRAPDSVSKSAKKGKGNINLAGKSHERS